MYLYKDRNIFCRKHSLCIIIIYMNLNILGDFQICISTPLSYFYLVYLFMSFFIYFFPFVFKFFFLSLVSELKISRSNHREEFLIIKILVRRGHSVRNFANKKTAALLEISSFISISMGTVT